MGGFLSVMTYFESDTCEEAKLHPNYTYTFNCKKEENEEKWQTFACELDASGYVEVPLAMYNNDTGDCSTEPMSVTSLVKLGECSLDSSLRDGTWTSKSSKMSISDGVVTHEEFSSADCSGTATKAITVTCGECGSTGDDDNSYIIITCPGEADGPNKAGSANGAFQPSRTLPMLTLLAVGAVTA